MRLAVWPTAGLRGKSFAALGLLGLSGVFCNATNGVVWRQSIPYYTQVEVVLGLGSHLRLGLNPGELLDFVLGWTTIDIFGDDHEARKQRKKSEAVEETTNPPSTANTAGDRIEELVTVFGDVYRDEIYWHPELDQYIVQRGGVRHSIRRDHVKQVTFALADP